MTGATLSRRHFLAALGAGTATTLATGVAATVAARAAAAQTSTPAADTAMQSSASNVAMDDSAYREVKRAPKPGAVPQLTVDQRDALEHRIGCMCPCTLDVYTCRTTDFSCGISPAMHRDVLGLVQGGYSADEIIASFVDTYGEQVLMEPTKSGFNWAGYLAPFAALGTGGIVVATLIRRWGRRAPVAVVAGPLAPDVDASADELARLDAAVRGDGR